MSVAVRLATNYEKISRQDTATILLSTHIHALLLIFFNCHGVIKYVITLGQTISDHNKQIDSIKRIPFSTEQASS